MQISVRAARVNKGMTQKEVANALGISINAYRGRENGQLKFFAHELARLSDLFDMPLLNFLESECHIQTQKGVNWGVI